jgi:hypothetical protein
VTRARSDIGDIERQLMRACDACRTDTDEWEIIETFIALALRVLAKTNPSKIRDAALTLEIQARIKNRPQGAGETSN